MENKVSRAHVLTLRSQQMRRQMTHFSKQLTKIHLKARTPGVYKGRGVSDMFFVFDQSYLQAKVSIVDRDEWVCLCNDTGRSSCAVRCGRVRPRDTAYVKGDDSLKACTCSHVHVSRCTPKRRRGELEGAGWAGRTRAPSSCHSDGHRSFPSPQWNAHARLVEK